MIYIVYLFKIIRKKYICTCDVSDDLYLKQIFPCIIKKDILVNNDSGDTVMVFNCYFQQYFSYMVSISLLLKDKTTDLSQVIDNAVF